MAVVVWDAFLGEVLPYVQGCTEPFAVNAIRNAARIYCERTRYYKVFLNPVTIGPGPVYAFASMPTQTQVCMILHGRLGTTARMLYKDQDWLEQNLAVGWETLTGTPKFITQDDEENYRVVPYPTVALADQLVLRVALQPTEDSTQIDRVLFRFHKERIAHGALAILMATPGVPFTNPDLAETHRAAFGAAIGDIAWKAFKGHVRARPRVAGHYF